MTGMAQKGGPVTSHIRIATHPSQLSATRIPASSADLILACDLVVSTSKEIFDSIGPSRTSVIANTEKTITHQFLTDARFDFDPGDLLQMLASRVGSEDVLPIAATKCAVDLFGDTVATNLFMVGYAYQKGFIPVSSSSVLSAIELNGVAVEMNTIAFRIGRLAAHDNSVIQRHLETPGRSSALAHRSPSSSLSEVIDRRAKFLSEYQDAKYAASYLRLVGKVSEVEAINAYRFILLHQLSLDGERKVANQERSPMERGFFRCLLFFRN